MSSWWIPSRLLQWEDVAAGIVAGGYFLSVERKSMFSQIGRERRAFGLRGLARLVLRPSVESRLAEFGVGSVLLPGNAVPRIAPVVIVVDRLRKRAVVVAVAVGGGATRQAQADKPFAMRVTQTKACDRKHQIGQTKYRRDLVDFVANDADRTDAEPGGFRAQDHGLHGDGGIDAGIEESFQRAVAHRLAAQFADPLQPS